MLQYRPGVAEHARGQQAAAGDTRVGPQDLAGPPHPALDRGGREIRRYPAGGRAGADGGNEPGPAGKAQFPCDDQLGGGQADRAAAGSGVMARQPLQGRGIAPPGGVTQFLGPQAQLAEVGALWKRIGHGFSLRGLRSAAQAEEDATAAHAR